MTPKLTILHYVAKALGLLVHVDGMPLGSARNIPVNLHPGPQDPFPGSQQQSGWSSID